MLASNIVDLARQILADEDSDNYRWPDPDMLAYLNEAQRVLAVVRPDAAAVREAVQLAPGVKQAVPATGLRFIGLVRNMGINGTVPGRRITHIDSDSLGAYDLDWDTLTPVTVIKHSLYDEDDPLNFDVYPPVHASTPVYVEMVYSKTPVELTDLGDAIGFSDSYSGALIQWVVYMAFSTDISSATSMARASGHGSMFFNILGVKMQADLIVSPNKENQ